MIYEAIHDEKTASVKTNETFTTAAFMKTNLLAAPVRD
jgi:hypothetical protein